MNNERKESIMLTPGTLRVSPRVLEASSKSQLNHRSPEIEEAFEVIKTNLRKIIPLPNNFELVFFPTTGRGGLEAIIAATVSSHKTLVVVNGRWATYMAEVAKENSANIDILELPHDAPIDTAKLREAIVAKKPKAVCFVSHETERGLLNPSKEVIALCKEHDCYAVIDTMSSVVIEQTDFATSGASAFCFSASKGLRSLRDMGIVAVEKSFAETLSDKGNYLNFAVEYKRQQKGLPRNPFSTSSVLALREATSELLEEGVERRRAAIQESMRIVRDWAKARNFEQITKPEYLGWCTMPFRLPGEWTYPAFRKELLERGYDVFYSYEGEEGKTFEVSTMGYLSQDDVRGFTKAVDDILRLV